MTDSFDLTTQPWIPCEFLDGRNVELSTRDALAEAHRIRAIVDPSPLVVAVLHRHLLAVLHRGYQGPKTKKEWSRIAQGGCFDGAAIETYLGSVRDRMDLFHSTHPFAQTRGLVDQFPPDPIDGLLLERSSWGTARELFQHRPADYEASMTPAQAARALLAHQAFATGGLVKKPNEPVSATAAPLVRAAVVLLRGETLFHTLISNLLVYDPAQSLPVSANENDAPAWEQELLPKKLRMKQEPKRLCNGWLDMLTWVSRRIELVRGAEQVVGFVRCVGQGVKEGSPLDPMVTYRADEKRGFLSIGVDPERAFWRNANALFEAARSDGQRFQRPRAFDQAASPEVQDILAPSTIYRIDISGLAAEKSRVDLARAEHLAAAARLFADPDAREAVEHALRFAEDAVNHLQKALYVFACHVLPRAESESKEQQHERWMLVRSLGAETAAWSALGIAFETFLLAVASDKDSARRAFELRVEQVIHETFTAAIASAISDGRGIRARALAEMTLGRGLAALPRTEPSGAEPDTAREADA